ncbi:hypothetical protein PL8927_270273 [Planktothrix serta PCC 8927]|uniref:Uncharacterized protein n=1 Tax=Planktothrix serta PCC 8927 TaxID=671068 RepID=A0A7Z9BMJ2_9CYAN|nr:hypothetical protein PL8927_270273 [Planktothrix serta PCC 8927]
MQLMARVRSSSAPNRSFVSQERGFRLLKDLLFLTGQKPGSWRVVLSYFQGANLKLNQSFKGRKTIICKNH